MSLPGKTEREKLEVSGFIDAYAEFPEARTLEVVTKGEAPDYVVRDRATGQEFGVELTSVYIDDRSVPDVHMRKQEGFVEIPHDMEELERYEKRLIAAIIDKVCKARKGYDTQRPLILAVYLNEYISIYLGAKELQ